jgi:ParB family chromosome partitioning protein
MRTRIPIEEGAEEPRWAWLKAQSALHIERRRRTMTMQTVSLSSLDPGRGNPRKATDRRSLEGLAASIRNDGRLQNLVVSQVKGKGQHYRIVSGERRYRDLKLLQERGEVDEDFAVPVEIRVSLSKDDSLRIATVENLQRSTMSRRGPA